MSAKSKIEWTDATWNPVTGCTKVSQGCKHCYAEAIFQRPYPGRDFTNVRTHDRDGERLRKGLSAVRDLINESTGVYGLHLNGDVSPWDELRTGGRFEEWLMDFDAAIDAAMRAEG